MKINHLLLLASSLTNLRELHKLFFTRSSAAEIRAVEQETGGDIFENREATAANFLKNMSESRQLHVATQGIFSSENSLLSGLLFSKKSLDDSLPNLLTVSGMYGCGLRRTSFFSPLATQSTTN